MEISWEWQHSRSGFFTFAALCMLCCFESTSSHYYQHVTPHVGQSWETALVNWEARRDLSWIKPRALNLFSTWFHPSFSLTPTHTHKHTRKVRVDWFREVGRRLCFYIQFENMICCSYWKGVGGVEKLTIFSGIVEVEAARYVRKWQCVDLSWALK